MVGWAAVRGVPTDSNPLPLSGRFGDIADVFTSAGSPRRLVVLGPGGAGKSMLALRLVLDLLDRLGPDDPVPVLLPVATWDPRRQRLHPWIAERLAEEYRFLAARGDPSHQTRATLAGELVTDGQILPVLDGFDEIPQPRRAQALAAIGRSLRRHDQLVLTSRPAEYAEAATAERPLPGTPVVELVPLDPVDVAEYLLAATAGPATRWKPVTDELRARPTGPLACALSTPLMVWLARTVYGGRSTNPGELVGPDLAGNPAAIEEHLLDALVPAAYRNTQPDDGRPTRWTAARAGRWLGFLAHHLTVDRTYGLYWWRLHGAVPRIGSMITVGAVGGLLGALIGGSRAGLLVGLALGLVLGTVRLLGGFGLYIVLALAFAHVFAGGALIGLDRPFTGAAVLVVALWLLTGPFTYTTRPQDLQTGRRRALIAGLTASIPFSLAVDAAYGLSPTPVAGLPVGFVHPLITGLAGGTIWVLIFTKWGCWLLARLWLAMTGRLPWSLGRFLRDAHRRGVLRQEGDVYQFRHARLQLRLARARQA